MEDIPRLFKIKDPGFDEFRMVLVGFAQVRQVSHRFATVFIGFAMF